LCKYYSRWDSHGLASQEPDVRRVRDKEIDYTTQTHTQQTHTANNNSLCNFAKTVCLKASY
jgi:hypothetical protein